MNYIGVATLKLHLKSRKDTFHCNKLENFLVFSVFSRVFVKHILRGIGRMTDPTGSLTINAPNFLRRFI